METSPVILRNEYLYARFDPKVGELVHLSADPRGDSLIDSVQNHYRLDGEWVEQKKHFKARNVQTGDDFVQAVSRSEHVEVTRRYELSPGDPMLRVSVTVRGFKRRTTLQAPAFPAVSFTDDFIDAFEDDTDLYDDGVELGGGAELPCWRVFFRKGRQIGILIATRSKRDMSRFQILERGFQIKPHTMVAYDSGNLGRPMIVTPRHRRHVQFEIGPWSPGKHEQLLDAAHLREPVMLDRPAPQGRAKKNHKGKLFDAIDFAPAAAVSETYKPGKWMLATMPWAHGGKALFASTGIDAPPIRLDPQLKGVYRVFVGIANGEGAVMKLTGDKYPRIRRRPVDDRLAQRTSAGASDIHDAYENTPFGDTPFRLWLSGRHRALEIDFGIERMDGRKITLERIPNRDEPCAIDYIRFEKLNRKEVAEWEATEQREPCIPLAGLADIVDLFRSLDSRDPDPIAYASNVAEHARCGFRKIYWRIDGQCSDFQSKVNTVRYISARVHGIFKPQAKAYGRVLKSHDLLRVAADAAAESGIELWGWMRFNNYSGNVKSAFYVDNPQFHEQWEDGTSAPKLCLAFPEVRKHKIDILVEAAKYGLTGVNLGFLRHPPVLCYHPILVEGYQKETGNLPPRNLKYPDPRHLTSMPRAGGEYDRWHKYRASYMTTFGRELRAALRENGLGHVKVALWVRPNHCLFDGIDMDYWLAEGLCDEVVAGAIVRQYDLECPEVYEVDPEWKATVQRYVPLYRNIWMSDYRAACQRADEIIADGYDGICTYESNEAVLTSDMIRFYRSLRT